MDENETPTAPPPARNFWDEWELEARHKMIFEFGHSWQSAASLARYMRWSLQYELNKPIPLSLYIGGV